ncbi:MAG: aryl-sulfate sulfotransferase [Thermodesulfobacteriota bacterium]
MNRRTFLTSAAIGALGVMLRPLHARAFPTVFPHGTTIYKPEKCWSGYTVFGTEVESEGSVLIDMNGSVVRQWKDIGKEDHPPKILKGGYIAGTHRPSPEKKGRIWGLEDSSDLVVADFNGKIVRTIPKAGMHHDFQFEGNPVGYYVPDMPLDNYKGKMLVLSNKIVKDPRITDKDILDDVIYELDSKGQIIWEWSGVDHLDEMGFTDDIRKTMFKYPTFSMTRNAGVKAGDWIHVNSASYLGPNKWYDEDPRKYAMFNPQNIIVSCRQTNSSFIIDKETGKIVWRIGPLYYSDIVWEFAGEQYPQAYKKLEQIVGQHHTHMIPKGLPGEGNIMIYDNGGYGGYGPRNPGAHYGWSDARRDYSRVIEFDPRTLEVKWQHSAKEMGMRNKYQFYSDYVSSAQRLPNGNTLITNGAVGQLQEVTPDHEIVWEYISPYYTANGKYNLVYRAYRLPYDYVPQLKKPVEKAVTPPNNVDFRIQSSS